MVADQTAHNRYWASASQPAREIELVARIELATDGAADVDTELPYEALPAAWDEAIARQIYDGVHAGLAAIGGSLPREGVRISFSDLRVTPPLAGDPSPAGVRAIGETVRVIAASAVESLWSGLRQAAAAEESAGR